MVAPILTPGAVIGISTLLFWNKFSVPAGLHLSVLGQVSYIAAFVMLLVLARLQSFDRQLEEAALDLGASHAQVLRRILLPHLYPAIGAGAAIAFFQSIENFNTTLFTRGTYDTLTVYVFSKVRSGITPTINALALILISVTVVCAIWYEVSRRRAERRAARSAHRFWRLRRRRVVGSSARRPGQSRSRHDQRAFAPPMMPDLPVVEEIVEPPIPITSPASVESPGRCSTTTRR